ncbi:hypothetical protein DFJ63DRAFT_318833 [Scheffersomyces coipomensis]|uniref:uncharacterized protein n=1 Tax=Scheffersomyces coipomensis TaxID=1788519 RepID=UPI00315C8DC2
MSDILEKSLDDIIGENKPSHQRRSQGGSSYRRGGPTHAYRSKYLSSSRTYRPYDRNSSRPSSAPLPGARANSSLSKDIQGLAGNRPVLRVKNIHPDLNGEDLSNLFGNVSPVDFVKFDNRNDDIAYVCFHNDNARSNSEAIDKFNGKKAMGQTLIVENAQSLAERIKILPVNERIRPASAPKERDTYRGTSRPISRERKVKPKPSKKSLTDLDDELNAYMNGTTTEQQQEEHTLPEPSFDPSSLEPQEDHSAAPAEDEVML